MAPSISKVRVDNLDAKIPNITIKGTSKPAHKLAKVPT